MWPLALRLEFLEGISHVHYHLGTGEEEGSYLRSLRVEVR